MNGAYTTDREETRSVVLRENVLQAGEKPIGLNNLAGLLQSQGKYDEAKPLYEEAIGILKRSLGGDHPQVAVGLNNLALLLKAQGKNAEAQRMGNESVQIFERALGPNHPNTRTVRQTWGSVERGECNSMERMI